MRKSVCLCLTIWVSLLAAELRPVSAALPVVVDSTLSAPADLALADLEQVLRNRGLDVARQETLPREGSLAVVAGVADRSDTVKRLLATHSISLPREPESLCIRKLRDGDKTIVLIAGRDARGLSYALTEAARAVELSPANDPWAGITETVEAPYLRVRSLTVHLFNADLERSWYFDERYWRGYFAHLARCRYNQLTLTFADQTNYLCPVYAYLVEVPGFPEVRAQGLTVQERRRNLEMLRRIAELARERGIDFNLGIWMQMPLPRYSAKVLVGPLPQDERAADYCARGLKKVLDACPAISGVQLRMNAEAGVPEEQQTAFYRPLFRAIRAIPRPIRVDLRYKGLRPETTQEALDTGLDVTVSSKLWCEHMGLPYHPTVVDPLYRASRYSFGSMLEQPRKYRVIYRHWTVGSQRLLLWGDPDYAARFARSCRLGGGEGFEVFAPLTNRGYGNEPGVWPLFVDQSYQQSAWDYERYWFFHLTFGRLGYNPETGPEVWRRELRQRFGAAAGDLEAAYRQASQILPLITAAHLPSASEWSWWPEMDTGDGLVEYAYTQPSDTGQFYAIRTWKRTPRWRCEAWDATVRGYAEDAVTGQLCGKWTPQQVSSKLQSLAEQTLACLERARPKMADPKTAEHRATELDLRVLAQLGLYHAQKTRAATHLAFFDLTGESGRLSAAREPLRKAVAAWEDIVRLTDGVYHDKMVFGTSPANTRNDFGHHHSGHWKDRLAAVREDVAYLDRLLQKHGGMGEKYRTFPGETPPAALPRIEHTPIVLARPGRDLSLSVRVSGTPRQVLLHYRPLNQTMDWKAQVMRKIDVDQYEAVVPSREISARWDWQYFVEVLTENGGRRWPSWEEGPPYVVVRINRP